LLQYLIIVVLDDVHCSSNIDVEMVNNVSSKQINQKENNTTFAAQVFTRIVCPQVCQRTVFIIESIYLIKKIFVIHTV